MNIFKKFNKWWKDRQEPEYEIEEWQEITYNRDELNVNDKEERQEYVRGCLEQIADATKEVDVLQLEYNMVTSYLKDMEEIDALPTEERLELEEAAAMINQVEGSREEYLSRSGKMAESEFRKMEALIDEVEQGYQKIKEAEEYQNLIKADMKKLDGEKQAYFYRKHDLKNAIEDMKNMSIVTIAALVLCLVLLLGLQTFLELDIQVGYLIAIGAAAIAITFLFLKHSEAKIESKKVEKGINKIILLQNRVKIRYINNTNLLDYLYMKFDVSNAAQLNKRWEQYQNEKAAREKYRTVERELDEYQRELLGILRRYQIKDPAIWLHQTNAILDKKEMVEVRHNLIIRRQSLRRRIDYNKEVIAHNAQDEIKDLVSKYPQYAKEILGIVDEYERKYQK